MKESVILFWFNKANDLQLQVHLSTGIMLLYLLSIVKYDLSATSLREVKMLFPWLRVGHAIHRFL